MKIFFEKKVTQIKAFLMKNFFALSNKRNILEIYKRAARLIVLEHVTMHNNLFK